MASHEECRAALERLAARLATVDGDDHRHQIVLEDAPETFDNGNGACVWLRFMPVTVPEPEPV